MGVEFREVSAERSNAKGESGGEGNAAICSPGIEAQDERGDGVAPETRNTMVERGLPADRKLPGIIPNGRGNGPDPL